MAELACAIVMVVAFFQIGETQQRDATQAPTTASYRQLYNQAAQAIASQDYDQAIESLTAAIRVAPSPGDARQLRLHLVECCLAGQRYQEALKILGSVAERDSEDQQSSQAEVERSKLQTLRARALLGAAEGCRASADYLEANAMYRLAQKLITEPKLSGQVKTRVVQTGIQACAKLYAEHGDIEDFLIEMAPSEGQLIRLGFAESQLKLGALDLAESQLQRLDEEIRKQKKFPDWVSGMWLRQAEIDYRQNEFDGAIQRLQFAQKGNLADASQSVQTTEHMQLLLAKCHIAKIEFESAIQVLTSLVTGDNRKLDASQAAIAEATWMIGEIHFMRRDYPQAIHWYTQLETSDAPLWTKRACLQKAKCLELNGQHEAAKQSYSNLQQRFPDSQESEFAAKRIAVLEPFLQNPTTLR